MADEKEIIEGTESIERDEIFSRAIRAGKRTYFFDVKATRRNDYYLTITESKKRFNRDGRFYYEKHKIFLYKEDFDKFFEGLEDAIGFIKENQPAEQLESDINNDKADGTLNYTDVEFEDLEVGIPAEESQKE